MIRCQTQHAPSQLGNEALWVKGLELRKVLAERYWDVAGKDKLKRSAHTYVPLCQW